MSTPCDLLVKLLLQRIKNILYTFDSVNSLNNPCAQHSHFKCSSLNVFTTDHGQPILRRVLKICTPGPPPPPTAGCILTLVRTIQWPTSFIFWIKDHMGFSYTHWHCATKNISKLERRGQVLPSQSLGGKLSVNGLEDITTVKNRLSTSVVVQSSHLFKTTIRLNCP